MFKILQTLPSHIGYWCKQDRGFSIVFGRELYNAKKISSRIPKVTNKIAFCRVTKLFQRSNDYDLTWILISTEQRFFFSAVRKLENKPSILWMHISEVLSLHSWHWVHSQLCPFLAVRNPLYLSELQFFLKLCTFIWQFANVLGGAEIVKTAGFLLSGRLLKQWSPGELEFPP